MSALHTGKGKAVPMHAIKAYRGIGGTAPIIRNLGTRGREVVKFKLPPLYPRAKNSEHPLEFESWSAPEPVWAFWGRKISYPCWNSNLVPSSSQPIPYEYVPSVSTLKKKKKNSSHRVICVS